MKAWVYKYGLDAGVVVAEDLAAALDDLRFPGEHELLMAELPAGSSYHAALLPADSDEPSRWVSLSPDLTRTELEFVSVCPLPVTGV